MALNLADAGNKFEDLSGVDIKAGDNPYDALINACNGSPVSYTTSRTLGLEDTMG
jgi:hypothetical protein